MDHFNVFSFLTLLRIAAPMCSDVDSAIFVGLLPVFPKPPRPSGEFLPSPQSGKEPKPIALQSVQVNATVKAWAVGVTADLTYRNTLNETIECQFVFPMADSAAVYKMEAVFGDGRKIKAEIHPREEAEKIYQQAIDSGQQAVLMQNQKGSTDIYRILLGNLAPNETAIVTVGYAQPMGRDPDTALLSLTLPVVLNPRYVPVHEILDPEAMKRNFHVTVPYVAVSQVSYTMKLRATVDIGLEGKIVDIKPGNASDLLDIQYKDSDRRFANVALLGNFRQDHDFRLLITTEKSLKPAAYVEPGIESSDDSGVASPWLGYQVAAAWFEPIQTGDADELSKDEYWFIIDRSGSMDGQKQSDAQEALLLFIRSLPFGCTFNIIEFGTAYEVLFKKGAVKYDETTMKTALNYVESMSGNLGGTEIMQPFQYVYNQELPTAEGSKRFIVILTDGEVGNTDEVIGIAQRNAATTRVFAIGIGEGSSTALIDGVTRVSNGMADYVRSSSDRLQGKVVSLLKSTTMPAADNINLSWNVGGGQVVVKEPTVLPVAAFKGRSVMQYAVIQRGTGNLAASVEMSAVLKDKPVSYKLPFSISKEDLPAGSDDSLPLHRLAVKARLVNLTDRYRLTKEESVKQEAIVISMATGVLCEFTSYVAVDSKTRRQLNDSQGRPLRVNIERPSEYDWAPKWSMSWNGGLLLTTMSTRPLPSDGGGRIVAGSSFASLSIALAILARFYSGLPLSNTTTPAPSTKKPTALRQFLDLQNFDGSWSLNAQLVEAVNSFNVTSVGSLKSLVNDTIGTVLPQQGGSNDDAVYSTLVGIAVLRRRFTANSDEWQLLEEKAIRFLRTKGFPVADIDMSMHISAIADALQLLQCKK